MRHGHLTRGPECDRPTARSRTNCYQRRVTSTVPTSSSADSQNQDLMPGYGLTLTYVDVWP
jgi:hypothetical protein